MTWFTPRQVSTIGGALDTRDIFMNVPSDIAADITAGDVLHCDTTGESGDVITWQPGVDGSAYSTVWDPAGGVASGIVSYGVHMVALEDAKADDKSVKFRVMGVARALTDGATTQGAFMAVNAASKAIDSLGPTSAGVKIVAIAHETNGAAGLASMYFNGYGFGVDAGT